MLKGAKSWEEMRAELPLDMQQRLDQRADEKAKAAVPENTSATDPARKPKPAA